MGKWQKHNKHHKQESQEVRPFQAGDYKTAMNRQESMTNINNKNDPQKKHRLGNTFLF